MKERPILFSGPMVRAILEGRKTQTRRIISESCRIGYPHHEIKAAGIGGFTADYDLDFSWKCPYGQPGDRLWVRENGWERPERTRRMMREGADTWLPYYYDADGITECDREDFKSWGFKRRPSIHMPRWASRITLEIVNVRVERLKDISEDDAMAEGIWRFGREPTAKYAVNTPNWMSGHSFLTARNAYAALWESINGKGSWDANPWVWVIEFRRVAS